MHALSVKAKNFLAGRERFATTISREDILKVFAQDNVPIYEPLIDFQQNYSGYDLSINSDIPFVFNLLRGEGGYPQITETTYIGYTGNDQKNLSRYYFSIYSCEMMGYVLDENGVY